MLLVNTGQRGRACNAVWTSALVTGTAGVTGALPEVLVFPEVVGKQQEPSSGDSNYHDK